MEKACWACGVAWLAVLAAALCLVGSWGPCGAATAGAAAEKDESPSFSYDDYAAVLEKFVDGEGMVDYKGLKGDSARLDAFLVALAEIDATAFEKWGEKERIALWINAYNALTLKALIDHYPIKSSFARSLRYPKNSIRQIPGVWKRLKWRVMGREMTLDQVEHGTLRAKFNEPRIHVALVCAAKGCPPLGKEPYTAGNLDDQLDGQAKGFFKKPAKFRVARDKGRVYLSPIFKWFGEDFVETFGTDERFKRHGRAQRAVLNFVSGYLADFDRKYLETGKFSIKYLDYDWELNEQGR